MKANIFEVKIDITASDTDTLYIPIGRGVIDYKVLSTIEPYEEFEEFKDEYNNQYISLNVQPNETITFQREVVSFPPLPDINPKLCLKNDERFCKWKQEGYIEKSMSKDKKISDKEKVLQYVDRIKQIKYSYPRTKYEYTDEVLENKLPQDCLGYHGTLCAMLRCSGIPSIVDIGFRLTEDDKPHVWLWYYDRQESDWSIVDINDYISKESMNTPRMSVTLGTTHNIKNHTVSYVQYFVSEKILKGELNNFHEIKMNIL